MIEFASTFSRELDIVESDSWLNLMFEDGIGGGSAGFTEETLEKMRNAGKFKRTPEQRANMSAGSKTRPPVSYETKSKISFSRQGHVNSEESLEKMRQALLNLPFKPHEIIKCPHCGESGGRSNMTRYHFDNCKDNPLNAGIAKNRKVQKDICCPHCGKIGKSGGMETYHFDNCKHNPLNSGITLNDNVSKKVTCPNCGKTGGIGPMSRFHFDNCKSLKNKEI